MKRLLYFLAALLFALPMTAAAQPSVHVVSGPYLQAVGEREFTVVWTTNIDAVSWVEIAPDDGTHFYNTERPKYYQVLNGRRPIGKLHVVTVSGLEPATTYRYRVMQNGVLVNEGRKRVIFGEGFGSDILRHKPFEVTTLDRSKSEVAFSVVNDMHEHDSILRVLYKDVKPGKYDFVCFNGDMTTSIGRRERADGSLPRLVVGALRLRYAALRGARQPREPRYVRHGVDELLSFVDGASLLFVPSGARLLHRASTAAKTSPTATSATWI